MWLAFWPPRLQSTLKCTDVGFSAELIHPLLFLRVNIRKYLTAKSSKLWPSLRSWTAAKKTSLMESDLQIFMKQNSVALHHLSHYITHLTACSVLYPSLPSSLACASVWLVLQRWSSWVPTQLFSISSQWDPLIFSLQRFCITLWLLALVAVLDLVWMQPDPTSECQ